MRDYIFLRGLRHVDHTVFAVANGQKTYRDPQFNREVAYASGQQVKRSLLDELVSQMGIGRAPVTFRYKLEGKNKAPGEDIALQQLDPRHIDELLGGYMRAEGKGTQKGNEEPTGVIKRRSPLSISAMTPLHPLLASVDTEEAISFDRTDDGNSDVELLDKNGKPMSKEEMLQYLRENDLYLRKAKYVDARNQRRAYGYYAYNVAVDLRRLFAVQIDETQPEVAPSRQETLREEGWQEGWNAFGRCLICPKEQREAAIPALAEALIDWQITSNQARNYSPPDTQAVALSDQAHAVNGAIRARLTEGDYGMKALPVLDEQAGADLFVHLTAEYGIPDVETRSDALDNAKSWLKERLGAYDYDAMRAEA